MRKPFEIFLLTVLYGVSLKYSNAIVLNECAFLASLKNILSPAFIFSIINLVLPYFPEYCRAGILTPFSIFKVICQNSAIKTRGLGLAFSQTRICAGIRKLETSCKTSLSVSGTYMFPLFFNAIPLLI